MAADCRKDRRDRDVVWLGLTWREAGQVLGREFRSQYIMDLPLSTYKDLALPARINRP